MKAAVLIGQAVRGEPSATQHLIELADDRNADKRERETAVRFLGQGRLEFRQAVARQLLDPDPDIRTTAYYSLPKEDRPAGFDYTAQPSSESERVVQELLRKLK